MIEASTDTPTSLPASSSRFSWGWTAFAVAAVIVVALFGVWPYQHWDLNYRISIFGGLVKLALHDSEWLFSLAVPFITAFLVYLIRDKLKATPLQGEWSGAWVLLAALGVYWIGYKADTGYPGFIAAQLMELGLILLIAGRQWLRLLFFPWLFLSFMWPLLPLESYLAVPLRTLTADVSSKFVNLMGLAVVREGTSLHSAADAVRGLKMGDLFRLDVDDACSGMRSLYALLMISALYGYLALRGFWPRLLLFLSAIPLAMTGNFVRMVLLAFGSKWFGTDFAVGRNIDGHQEMSLYHELAGFAVFAVALAGMFALCNLFERKGFKLKKTQKRPPTSKPAKPALDIPKLKMRVGVALAIAVLTLGICLATDSSYKVGPPGISLTMPTRLGEYEGTVKSMTSQEKAILYDDVQIARTLYTTNTRAILATAVLSGAVKRSLHPPEVCLPSQGWAFSSKSIIPIQMEDGRTLYATLLHMFSDREDENGRRFRARALNVFWYEGSNGTSVASYDEHVVRSYVDAVFRNLNHRWSLMSFFVPLPEQSATGADPFAELNAVEDTKNFIRQFMAKIQSAG